MHGSFVVNANLFFAFLLIYLYLLQRDSYIDEKSDLFARFRTYSIPVKV